MTRVLQITEAERNVILERRRQVLGEGWSPANDDAYEHFELARAAAAYAESASDNNRDHAKMQMEPLKPPVPGIWPFDIEWFKSKSRRSDLVKCSALAIAQIEAIDRRSAVNRAEFDEIIAKGKDRKARATELAAQGKPVRLYRPNGAAAAVAGPDFEKPGVFRLTFLDTHGPTGHMEFQTLAGAIEEGLRYYSETPLPEP